jgi:hypothetical protein
MGWWKVESTEDVIGDRPLDVLGAAVDDIVGEYREMMNRRPTKREWEALLSAVLGAEDPETRPLDDGVIRSVRLELKV